MSEREKSRIRMAEWRKKNPERAREIKQRHLEKKRNGKPKRVLPPASLGNCCVCNELKWLPAKSKCSRCYSRDYMKEQRKAPNHRIKERVRERANRERNREKLRQKAKEYYWKNREKIAERKKAWRSKPENKQKDLEYSREYDKSEARKQSKQKYQQSEKYKEKQRRYKEKLKKARPAWADESALKKFYKNCPPGMSVDHIIPLNGANVSGLHVIENLQYLPRSENSRKRNTF